MDGTYTTPSICASYRAKIDKYAKAASGRIVGGKGKTSNAYDAYDYRKSHPWVKDPMSDRFAASMSASASAALDLLTDGRAEQAESLGAYLDDSIAACSLTKALAAAQSSVSKSDSLAERIIAKARTKPWYPRGYFEIIDGLAGRWVNGVSTCDYWCRDWNLNVYSRDGCENGVYAKIDISIGDLSVDWTNDTLGYLGRHAVGRLTFVSYYDYDGTLTGTITDASCY